MAIGKTEGAPPHLVLVLGRGVEDDGTVREGSPISGESWDQAMAAGKYIVDNLADFAETPTIVFSGAYTFVKDAGEELPLYSEADAMYIAANNVFDFSGKAHAEVDDRSKTSWGNYIYTSPYFEPGDRVAVSANVNQWRRARDIGRRVRPDVTYTPLPIAVQGGPHANDASKMSDLFATIAYAPMKLIPKGDIAAFKTRDAQIQAAIIRALELKNSLLAITGRRGNQSSAA